MSTMIENQVVQMQFDNAQFERNVSTSLSSIDKLKQSLNMTGASKGLENVSEATKGVNMSGLGSAVEAVQLKFSALGVMGVTALANITNSAVNAGKRIVSALTIDPIKTGFSEYETKINAIQTIMSNTASKGTTMEDVTRVIGELNTYADKTIYNFAEMTRNIGTFTAAGVGLEESASAIQGIANLAAASGSTSQQASTAMYQLSQALAAGTVKLMDWNSVVNAGMGGEKFQEALKSTAREHGIAVDDLIKKHGSFRESLSEGWISAEILNETLSKFTVEGAKAYADSMVKSGKYTQEQADALIKEAQAMEDAATKVKTFTQLWDTLKESAQSGWSQTWEIIIGDFEEAKETLTKFSEVIGGMIESAANARNELLQGWKDAGGRADLVDSLFNIFEAVMSVVKPIKEAFREIFPATTVDQLVGITRSIKEFTAKLKLGETASNNLKRTFKGLFAVLDIIKQVFVAVFKAVGSLFGTVGDLGGGILSVTAAFGDWLVKIRDAVKQSDIFNKILQGVVTVVTSAYKVVKNLLGIIKEKIVSPGFELFHSLLARIHERMSGVGKVASSMKDTVVSAFESMGSAAEGSTLVKVLQTVWEGIKTLASGLAKALGALTGGLFDKLANADFSGIFDFFNTLSFSAIAVFIAKFVKGFSDITESVGGFKDSVIGILDSVKGCFEAWQSSIKAEALKKIAVAVAILAASLLVLSFIDSDKLGGAIAAITMLFGELLGAMAIFSKLSGGMANTAKATGVMISVSVAVLILASALRIISSLELEQISNGLLGIAGLMAIVIAACKLLENGGNKIMKGATQLVMVAAAIKILSSACVDLAELGWEGLYIGLTGVGVLLGELALFLNTAQFSGKAISTAAGMVILAAAIKILASACADFGQMSWGELGKGLVSIGVLLAEIAAFTNFTGNAKNVISTGIALIAISAAMKIFASATQDMADMSWGELARGLIGMGSALLIVAGTLRLMPKNLIGMGVGLIAVSAAITILANSFVKMGGMEWSGIAKGLVSLGGALVIIAAGLHLMKGTLAGSAALLVAAAALAVLTPVLSILGAMTWSGIAKGLISIAGAFTIIGVAGALLGPIIPAILGLAGAMVLIGVGILAAGAGLAAFGAGLTALSVGFTTLASSLGVVVVGIVSLVSAFITGVIRGVGEGIIAFCNVIADGAYAIGAAVKAVVLSVCDVLVECAPVVAETVLTLLSELLSILAKHAPQIIDSLFDLILGLLKGLAQRIPDFIQGLLDIVVSVIQGVFDALGNIKLDLDFEDIINVGLLAGVMAALAGLSTLVPGAMAGVLGFGVVMAELAIVLAAVGALAQIPGLQWLINEGGDLLGAIGTAIGQLIGGLVGGVAKGFTNSLPEVGSDLSAFMANVQPFIDGARQIDSSLFDGVKTLIDVIFALTGANILESVTSWITGGSSLVKFGEQLAEFGPHIKSYADSVAGIDASAITASANAAQALSTMASNLPNSGGLISWFAGENDISTFGEQLVSFGTSIKSYSDSVSGVNAENVVASATAAKALVELSNHIPNEGGMIAWFTGENSVAKFGDDLIALGRGLLGFNLATVGINPEHMVATAGAAKALAEMTTYIPNEGGLVAWITGENSISRFATNLVDLGRGLKGFSDETIGIVPENIVAASNAAKALAEMTAVIPNSGGIVAWFTGENSISKFSGDLVTLGTGLKGFSDSIVGIIPENVTAAANAAKALAEMTNIIPNSGGVVSWFTGDNSLSKFSGELVDLGVGIRGFATATVGINIESVQAAANAAKTLAEMTNHVPNYGGMASWFTGEQSVSKFGGDLVSLGTGLNGFATATAGITPENVVAAANAAKTLAEMTVYIPNYGGMAAWFTGEQSVSKFSGDLTSLGQGLSGFAETTAGIVPENVTMAANAAKSLAEMTTHIPNSGGIKSWFAGDQSVSKFSDELPKLGKGLKGFSDAVVDIKPDQVSAAAEAAKGLAEMANVLPKTGGLAALFGGDEDISAFAEQLTSFGAAMKEYGDSVSGINLGQLSAATDAFASIASMARGLSGINFSNLSSFGTSLGTIGKDGVNKFIQAFTDATTRVAKAGGEMISELIDGATKAAKNIASTFKGFAEDAAGGAEKAYSTFYDAGSYLVDGFAAGISENDFKAEAKAAAMAQAAAQAAKDALDINSPSKVFRAIGRSVPEGFAQGVGQLGDAVNSSAMDMTEGALSPVQKAISKMSGMISNDIDAEPTIRPVLDLSEVRSGANVLSSMLGGDSLVGVSANVAAINTTMNRRAQNGSNDDVVSAINKLDKHMDKLGGDTYNFGGLTYREGDEVADALQTIIRAARVERRG